MGCGSSKGASAYVAASQDPPAPVKTEFDPESKPRQAPPVNDPAQVVESREAAKRVDDIVKGSGTSEFDNGQEAKPMPSASLRATAAPTVPSPPGTPPVAAEKPQAPAGPASAPMSKQGSHNSGQGAVSAGSVAEAAVVLTESTVATAAKQEQQEPAAVEQDSYLPVQVALNVNRAPSPQAARQTQELLQPLQPLQPLQQIQPLKSTSNASLRGGSGGDAGVVTGRSVALSEATSLQPFIASEPPSVNVSLTALPTTLPLAPSARQPSLPNGEREPQALPSAINSLPPAQSSRQLQPSVSAAPPRAPSPPPDPNDPWSSLQSQYRIRDQGAAEEPEETSGAVSSRSRTGPGNVPDGGKEVLVLGDDDPFSGHRNPMLTSMRSTARNGASLRPMVPAAQPKQNGWGAGQMARAGELMIGDDDWLENDRPPGVPAGLSAQLPGASWPQQKGSYGAGGAPAQPMDPHEALLKAPLAKGRHADDVQCEDIEDLDALLDDEMQEQRQGLSNKSLASKLAAYEAKFDNDD